MIRNETPREVFEPNLWPHFGDVIYGGVMRGTNRHIGRTGQKVLFLILALWLITGCNGNSEVDARAEELEAIGDQIAADIAATSTAIAEAPTPVPLTPTPLPTATPAPTPTPDPEAVLQQQAEAVALEYREGIVAVFQDPENGDLTRVIELELPNSPLADYGLRLTAELLEDREYLPGVIKQQILGSNFDGRDFVSVRFCTQTEAVWRHIDTDEVVFESNPDPFVTVVDVSLPTMQVTKLFETGEPCSFSEEEE